jgi:citrate lyase beta subunit
MKHNFHNPDFHFFKEPEKFDKLSPKETLQYCLGATLYMPGTKDVIDKMLTRSLGGLTSMVMCFEDAIQEDQVEDAEANVLKHLNSLADGVESGAISQAEIPLIFLRVRNHTQYKKFATRLDISTASMLSGFVFPKFDSSNADDYFALLQELNNNLGCSLYGMPILEGRLIAFAETRREELQTLRQLLEPFSDLILNIRVGGTDFSSVFGVRRGMNTSIYSILTVRDCLSDILNFFNRSGDGYTVSAPVWEYFLAYKQEDLGHLMDENIHSSLLNRNTIINPAVDGLLREVVQDVVNGFVGKTIIHPSHLRFVNAMQAVTSEEYEDAMQILDTTGGVVKSAKANKMNEINPHRNWAKRINSRAQAYGVVEDESSYLKLMLG